MREFILSLLIMVNVDYGHAAFYSSGVMEEVVAIRQAGWTANPLPVELPPIQDFIATPY